MPGSRPAKANRTLLNLELPAAGVCLGNLLSRIVGFANKHLSPLKPDQVIVGQLWEVRRVLWLEIAVNAATVLDCQAVDQEVSKTLFLDLRVW